MSLPHIHIYLKRYERKTIRKEKIFKLVSGYQIKEFQLKNRLISDGLLGDKTIKIFKDRFL